MRPRDDENMHPAAVAAMARTKPFPESRVIVDSNPDAAPSTTDPTFPYRRSIANMAEATMMRVVELETEAGKLADQSKALTEIAKKLRAAVVANT